MKHTKMILAFLIFTLLLAGCGTKNTDQSATKNNKSSSSELIEKEGVFNGKADSHTIEVTADNKTLELQVKDELQSELNTLAEGDAIKFKYSVNKNKQNELSSIEKSNK